MTPDELSRMTDEADSEEYSEFVEKFKPKRTTDDCFTPPEIYDVVADWVAHEYGLNRSDFVRPFYPGGDFENYDYKPSDIVVDNPPFSILAKIIDFYISHGVRFFLFAPSMTTIYYSTRPGICAVCVGVSVEYANGAKVRTSFLTNLEPDIAARSCVPLFNAVELMNKQLVTAKHRTTPKYSYPVNLVTSSMIDYRSRYGVEYAIPRADCVSVGKLDAMAALGKKGIYGRGLLLSREAAAREAEAREAAKREAEARAAAEHTITWELSEREWAIVDSIGGDSCERSS